MKADEFDENTEFEILNLKKEVVDEVMKFWNFKNPMTMFEAGVLLLQSLSVAAKWNCEKIYFEVLNEKGEKAFYEFKFADLIRAVSDPERPTGSTHSVEVKQNKVVEAENEEKPNQQ